MERTLAASVPSEAAVPRCKPTADEVRVVVVVLRGRHRQLWASGFYLAERRRSATVEAAVVLRAADHSEVELERKLADSAPSSSPAFAFGRGRPRGRWTRRRWGLLRARLPLIQH